ncbi:MAG: DsrE family protein [Gammaproteobacteria bacterium]|nr:DsrE family protein [Gammaproteobacteria bacterium]
MTTTTQKMSFTVTNFDHDLDRVAVPLALANNALAMGHDVLIWLTLEGVKLAKENAADSLIPKSFPPIKELLNNFMKNGGKFGVCPPCAKTHGVTDDNLIDSAEWMGAAALLEANQDRQTAWF